MHLQLGCAIVVAAALAVGPRSAGAQQRPALAFDVNVGIGAAVGGTFDVRAGPTIDALLSGHVGLPRHGSVIAGLALGAQTPLDGSDVCRLAPGGGCVPNLPTLYSIAALAGWERGAARGASARLMAGPGYYWSDDGKTFGLQARMDLSTPPIGPVALVASMRGAMLPSFHSEAIGLWALGLGLRVR